MEPGQDAELRRETEQRVAEQQQQQQQQLQPAEPSVTSRVLSTVVRTVVTDKRASGALALWIFGLLAVFVLPAPVAITPEKLAAFHTHSAVAAQVEDQLNTRIAALQQSSIILKSEQGWFPWFASAKEKARVKPYKDQYNEKKALVDEKSQEYALAEREANRQLGLFSAHGVQRTRDHFWHSFQQGKLIGRQNTMWDGFFLIVGRSRDYDSTLELVMNLAVYLVVNMTTAMFVMFWFFVFGLPRIIWSLGGNWASGVVFFAIAVLGAASVMTAFVGLLTGGVAGTMYGLYQMAGQQMRLQGEAGGQRRRLQGQTMPGFRHMQVGRDHYYRPVRQHQE